MNLEKAIVNNKMRLGIDIGAVISLMIIWLLFLGITGMIVICVMDGNYDIIPGVISLPAFVFVLLTHPLMQNPGNFEATMPDGTFRTFKMFYKKKEVIVQHECNDEGKFVMVKSGFQLENFSYADGSEIGYVTSFKISNYLEQWLKSNDLIAFEQREN